MRLARFWVLIGWLGTMGLGCGSSDSESSPVEDAGTPDSSGDSQEASLLDQTLEPDGTLDAPSEEASSGFGPNAAFNRFCDQDWQSSLSPATVGQLSGEYLGVYQDLPSGTHEIMKVIPEHPFQLTHLRIQFGGGTGPARVRLMTSFGRSYPDLENPAADLITPLEFSVTAEQKGQWLEFDVSSQEVFLQPTQHYMLVYEHLADQPYLALESLPAGEISRALMLVPGESMPYGSEGNFRMELRGNSFCRWDSAKRWFSDVPQELSSVASQRAAISDLNGDGHDDLILNPGHPVAYWGNGQGLFTAASQDPFPSASKASMLVFGDLDNDGDEDAFAATYITPDSDGDHKTLAQGDCDDTNKDVHPGAQEVPSNGLDDDCDGTVDDGTSTADTDQDGVSVAAHDCDDTHADTYPGAPELLDGRDNDCNGEVDESFPNSILLNDGVGHFTPVPSSGVEALDPSAAAALGDGNADGKLDIYWGNWLLHYPDATAVADRYVEGQGDGTFVDAAQSAGMVLNTARPCYGVMWTDFNNDGAQDVWVGNYGYAANLLWKNNGQGHFSDVASSVGVGKDSHGSQGGNTFGGDFGDIDNDGDLDLYTANIAHPRYQPNSDPSVFLINQGAPDFHFVDQRQALGLVYDEGDVNAAFADFDNDMDLDLVVASLYPGHYSRLYRNDGALGFTDVTYETQTAVNDSVSAVWSDIDEDGDLDLVIAARTGPQYVHVFTNRVGQQNHWVELLLEGTSSNRDGIGARVTLQAQGVTQMREVRGGQGHSNTQNSRWVHFGLASAQSIESLKVRWVGGAEETITGISANGRYRVVQGSGVGVIVPPR